LSEVGSFGRRRLAAIGAAVLAMGLLAPPGARAVEFNEIKLGPVTVHPTLRETVWYDSNLFLRGSGEEDSVEDWIFNFSGSIRLSVDRTRTALRRFGKFDPDFLNARFALDQVLQAIQYDQNRGTVGLRPDSFLGIDPGKESIRTLYTERFAASLGYAIDVYHFGKREEFQSTDHIGVVEIAYRSPFGLGLRLYDQFLAGNSVTSFRNRSVSQDSTLTFTGTDFTQNTLVAEVDYQVLDDYFVRLNYIWFDVRYDDELFDALDEAQIPGLGLPTFGGSLDADIFDFGLHTFTLDFVVTRFAHTVITVEGLLGLVVGTIDDETGTLGGGLLGTFVLEDDPRDAQVYEASLKIQRRVTEKVRVSASVGVHHRDFENNDLDITLIPPAPAVPVTSTATQSDKTAVIGSAEAVYRFRPRTTFVLGFDRNVTNTSSLDSLIIVNSGRFRVQQQFGRKIFTELGAALNFEEIEAGSFAEDRTDRVIGAFASATYELQTWLKFKATYEFLDRKSDLRSDDFNLHRASLGVEVAF